MFQERLLIWLLGSGVYLVLHALVYLVVLRSIETFRRERGIFAYHALSAIVVALSVLVGAALAPSWEALATVVAVVCLHGIYSMTFLEVWSLSQGSYSLTILRTVEESPPGTPIDEAGLEAVGIGKRQQRLDGITAIGLARRHADTLALTSLGMVVASGLGLIAWLANVRQDA
jgi:hypothetical protein